MNGKPKDHAAPRQQVVSMSPRCGLVAASIALVVSLVAACSESSQRMGEFETLQYKRGLIAERQAEISPDQAEKLMYHPGRTKAEIDAYFEILAEEHEARREAEAAELRRTRVGTEGAASGTAGSARPGTASPSTVPAGTPSSRSDGNP